MKRYLQLLLLCFVNLSSAQNGLVTYTTNWQKIASTQLGILPSTFDLSKPLQCNPNVNTIGFAHLKSVAFTNTITNSPNNVIVTFSNTNAPNWDSTCLWSNTVNLANYPQMAIYSSPGNTNASNAYFAASGSTKHSNQYLEGRFFASKAATLTPKSLPGADQQYFSSFLPPQSILERNNHLLGNMTHMDDGSVRLSGIIADSVSMDAETIYKPRGIVVTKGTFNAGAFTWVTDSFLPTQVITKSDGTKQIAPQHYIAFNAQGTVGYLVFFGCRSSSITANTGWQPIIYRTSNSGSSWTLLSAMDFSSPTFSVVMNQLQATVGNPSISIPYFNTNEGVGIAVDGQNKLSLFVSICSSKSSHPDSLHLPRTFGSQNYRYLYTPSHPNYIYNFSGNGISAWDLRLVGTLQSERPGKKLNEPGYAFNPWQADVNGDKVSSGARLQCAIGGTSIVHVVAYADTDTLQTGHHWNTLPNIKIIAKDGNSTGSTVAAEINSNTFTPSAVKDKAFFFNLSPRARQLSGSIGAYSGTQFGCALASLVNATASLPISVSNAPGLSPNVPAEHWYTTAAVNWIYSYFPPIELGISLVENSKTVKVYPNPSREMIVLDASEYLAYETLNYTIYDAVGRELKRDVITEPKQSIPLEDLAKGLYVLKLRNAKGQLLFVQKLIKE
jgi:hypothetical protein